MFTAKMWDNRRPVVNARSFEMYANVLKSKLCDVVELLHKEFLTRRPLRIAEKCRNQFTFAFKLSKYCRCSGKHEPLFKQCIQKNTADFEKRYLAYKEATVHHDFTPKRPSKTCLAPAQTIPYWRTSDLF